MADGFQERMQEGVRQLREMEKDMQTVQANRQLLDGQMKENEVVLEELRLVKEEGAIYKLVGSILLPQERQEAIANVAKRVEFIQSELKKTEARIKDLYVAIEAKQGDLVKMQQALRGSA